MENDKLYKILDGFKSKTEAYYYFGFLDNSYGIIKLKNIADSVGFDLNIYKERRKKPKKFCEWCNKELNNKQYKFCSHSCCASYSTPNRIVSEETKNKIRNTLLSKTKEKKVKIIFCKICCQKVCNNNEVCDHTKNWFNNLIPFSFNFNVIGTIDIYKEYYRIKDLLLKEYFDNKLSPKDISVKYNYDRNSENILHILKSFGISTRNLSEGGINACLCGKSNTCIDNKNTKYQYKHGWHMTWDNKQIYYRSSYELKFAKILDEEKIMYETEYFRIKYWDSQKYKYRVAIPDFYLPSDNKIIEVKSEYTFDKQNILDKFNEYLKLGFSVSLLYEHKEYTLEEIDNIKTRKDISTERQTYSSVGQSTSLIPKGLGIQIPLCLQNNSASIPSV